MRKIGMLDIKLRGISTKQYSTVNYLGCEVNKNRPGEVMALKVINKTNGRLRFRQEDKAFNSVRFIQVQMLHQRP